MLQLFDKMKFTQAYTVQCCTFSTTKDWKHAAFKSLLGHIRRKHPELVSKINQQARRAAMSQNGSGYWDDGKSRNSGWPQAPKSFRESWRSNVLERYVTRREW